MNLYNLINELQEKNVILQEGARASGDEKKEIILEEFLENEAEIEMLYNYIDYIDDLVKMCYNVEVFSSKFKSKFVECIINFDIILQTKKHIENKLLKGVA